MIPLVRSLLNSVPAGRWRLWAAIILASGATGASVALMGVAAWLLSRAAEHPPVLYLQAAAVGVRFFGISRAALRYTERLVGHDLALRLQGALRIRVYDRLSQTTVLGRRRGDLLARVTVDIDSIQDVLVRVLIPVVSASIVIVGTTVILAQFSTLNAMVLLGSALIAGWLMPWLAGRLNARADERVAGLRGDLSDAMQVAADASPDLVAYGYGHQVLARVENLDKQLREVEARGAWTRGVATAGQVLATGLAVAAALWIGAQAVATEEMLARNLAVIVLTPLALHEAFGTFTNAAQTWTRSRASIDRVIELLNIPLIGNGDRPEPHRGEQTESHPSTQASDEQTGPVQADIDVQDLVVGWPDSPPLVGPMSFRVAAGERVALVGPSGVGKTTIAATLLGLIPAQAGSATTIGLVSYLAQDAHIFHTSVSENVRIGLRDATPEQVQSALKDARVSVDSSRIVGDLGQRLSGGEERRVALARVLVSPYRPRVIILDEPTEHLDKDTSEEIMKDLWVATQEDAVLVITHDPSVVRMCDRVIEVSRISTSLSSE